jgi:hypothetical protein
MLPALVIGLCAFGTGVFGSLIFLDPSENSFCVPVNRASSVLAGFVATAGLALLLGASWPRPGEMVGAGLMIVAIGFLSLPPVLARRRAVRAVEAAAG